MSGTRTDADLLRRAAATIREDLAQVPAGPWAGIPLPPRPRRLLIDAAGRDVAEVHERSDTAAVSTAVERWRRTMPALADLLDDIAGWHKANNPGGPVPPGPMAIARAYLREPADGQPADQGEGSTHA